jgi:bacteriorhodopsin
MFYASVSDREGHADADHAQQQKRLFHVLTSLLTTFAFLSYFAMATGDGIVFQEADNTENKQHFITHVYNRQVFWARYVDVCLPRFSELR